VTAWQVSRGRLEPGVLAVCGIARREAGRRGSADRGSTVRRDGNASVTRIGTRLTELLVQQKATTFQAKWPKGFVIGVRERTNFDLKLSKVVKEVDNGRQMNSVTKISGETRQIESWCGW